MFDLYYILAKFNPKNFIPVRDSSSKSAVTTPTAAQHYLSTWGVTHFCAELSPYPTAERTIIGEVCNLSGVEWFAEPIRYFSHLQRKVHVSIFLCLLAFCAYPCLPPIYDSAEKKPIKMLCLQWKIHGPFSSVQELDSDANFILFFL